MHPNLSRLGDPPCAACDAALAAILLCPFWLPFAIALCKWVAHVL